LNIAETESCLPSLTVDQFHAGEPKKRMGPNSPRLLVAVLLFAMNAAALVAAQVQLAKKAGEDTESGGGGPVARGRYVVEGIARCTRCHTPLLPDGERDPGQWLMGAPVQIRPTYSAPNWALRAPRIAGSPPGTDAEFIRLMMTGISRTGKPLNPPMPQFRLTRVDAEAVLAYLKSLGH
jgi:mono/diheme cytochrome c family protein